MVILGSMSLGGNIVPVDVNATRGVQSLARRVTEKRRFCHGSLNPLLMSHLLVIGVLLFKGGSPAL
jgi:hypothetical protein